jgi:response regulator RpfG family c-di-GMP phosphodiesterase
MNARVMEEPTLLFADPDPESLMGTGKSPKLLAYQAIFSRSASEAKAKILDREQQLSAVFVNSSLSMPSALLLIREVHRARPGTPIYLVSTSADSSQILDKILANFAIEQILQKPLDLEQMTKLVNPLIKLPTPSRFETVGHYIPILASVLLSAKPSVYDLYVQLKSGRFIKVLEKGDVLQADRLEAYSQKGLTHFFISRKDHEKYLDEIDEVTAQILSSERVPVEVKLDQAVSYGHEVMKYLHEHGLNHNLLQYASTFAVHVQELVKQLDPKKNEILERFMSNAALYDHGVATAMIASFLAPHLGARSIVSVHVYGLASMLHDIGLHQGFDDEDEAKMSAEQLRIYRQHPLVGGALISTIANVSPAVIEGIVQHHERFTGLGFPNRSSGSEVTYVAEAIALSDEFVRLIYKRTASPEARDPVQELSEMVSKKFSPHIIDAFHSIFKRS